MPNDDILDFNSAPVKSKKSLHKQYSAAAFTKLQESLEHINREFAVVQYGGAVFIMHETGKTFHLMSEKDFLLLFKNKYYEDAESEEPKKIGPKWLSWSSRRDYKDVVFCPSPDHLEGVYNRWKGFAFSALNGGGEFNLFLDHIRINITAGNEANYNWVLDWLADMVQRPWRKPWTCLVLQSVEEGTGKGFFARHIGKLLGLHFMALEKPSQLVGKFNAHLEDKLLLFVDEGSLTEKSAADFLKALVTEPRLNIEGKGKPIREVNSYHRLIIASNNEHIIRAGLHDRRFMVLKVAAHSRNNLQYFTDIQNQLEGGEVENAGYESLLWFLKNRKYDEKNIMLPLRTTGLAEQKQYSFEGEMRWWHDCLCLGRIGEWEWDKNALSIETKNFYNAYIAWCDRLNVRDRLTESWLPRRLNENAGAMLYSESDGLSPRHYKMVRVDEARTAFEEKIGNTIKWEDS